jgi:hypothetical protein
MVDLDKYRADSLANWDDFSGNWADEHDFLHKATKGVADAIVDGVGAQPGQTILELAAGTGDVGFAVAERLGSDGKLIQTDFAPGMVETERRFAPRMRDSTTLTTACSTPSGWSSRTRASTASSAAMDTC